MTSNIYDFLIRDPIIQDSHDLVLEAAGRNNEKQIMTLFGWASPVAGTTWSSAILIGALQMQPSSVNMQVIL